MEPTQQQELPKEHMFEKPLTPSDVGKLNRLVIPKQHAEKYFPLNIGGDSVDKGLSLNFEDELGKFWSFRYSYWSSSQSYVLTKGWSRYVKEKQLASGDVVLFERHRSSEDGERLFIGWRRQGVDEGNSSSGLMVHGSDNGVWSRGLFSTSTTMFAAPYSTSSTQHGNQNYDAGYGGPEKQRIVGDTTGNSKRLIRLFGVNVECQSQPSTPHSIDADAYADASSSLSSQSLLHPHHRYHSNPTPTNGTSL